MKIWILAACAAFLACGYASLGELAHAPPEPRELAFLCDGGEALSVRFFPERGAAMLIRQGQAIALPQQPSGSGFIYSNSNSTHTLRGTSNALTVEIGRTAPLQCRAS